VRLAATELQSVITYPVVVAAANPDLKLLPSMTAQISFEVESLTDVLKIPNAALRFYPDTIEFVRPEDRPLLDGSQWARRRNSENEEEAEQNQSVNLSAEEKAESQRSSNRRHVWVEKSGMLHAIEVEVGFSDSRYTALVAGEIEDGMQLVTGKKSKS
jgi:HlyD family secretion protein